METQYHRANINHSHDLVKSKVLTLLRYKDTWLTVNELWQGCKFKSDATLRSHCGGWARRHTDKHGISHENLLVRQARGRAGATRTKWEYHISRRGIRWLTWNVDKAGLLDIILEELDLIPPTNPTDNKLIPDPESNTTSEISDDEIKKICQEVLNKHRTQNSNKDGFLDGNSKNSV
jgi:hypothetical protein